MNVKFCVKLGKNESYTCARLSKACGEESMKNSKCFKRQKRFKESSHVEITNEENAHHFLRYQEYC
jgi:hypothetical protein